MNEAPNVRFMTEAQRREGVPILERWLHATGDYVTRARTDLMDVNQRVLFDRMVHYWQEYNRWLMK
jgi:hypothetical protein